MENTVEFVSEHGFWAATFVVIVLIIGAVSLTIGFDVNKWQERRDKAKESKIRNLCTHTSLEYNAYEDSAVIASYFHKPAWTMSWSCRRCGIVTSDSRLPQDFMEHWGANPREWLQREERLLKELRKQRKI